MLPELLIFFLLVIISSLAFRRITGFTNILHIFHIYRQKKGIDYIKSFAKRNSWALELAAPLIGLATLGFVYALIRNDEKKDLARSIVLLFFLTLLALIPIAMKFDPFFFALFFLGGFSTVGLYAMFSVSVQIASQTYTGPASTLLIPGVTVPFISGIIAMAVILAVHEFAHGIYSARKGVPLKSVGLMFLTLIPAGAFVEIDDRALDKKSVLERLHIFGAGSFANLVAFAVFILPWFVLTSSTGYFIDGINLHSVNQSAPAGQYLHDGMHLQEVNGIKIGNFTDYLSAVQTIRINETSTVKADGEYYNITAVIHPENSTRGYLGITPGARIREPYDTLPWNLAWLLLLNIIEVLQWIVFLNFNLAVLNLLPLGYETRRNRGIKVDGYLMYREAIDWAFLRFGLKNKQKTTQTIMNWLGLFLLFIVLLTFFPRSLPKLF